MSNYHYNPAKIFMLESLSGAIGCKNGKSYELYLTTTVDEIKEGLCITKDNKIFLCTKVDSLIAYLTDGIEDIELFSQQKVDAIISTTNHKLGRFGVMPISESCVNNYLKTLSIEPPIETDVLVSKANAYLSLHNREGFPFELNIGDDKESIKYWN